MAYCSKIKSPGDILGLWAVTTTLYFSAIGNYFRTVIMKDPV